MDYWRMVRELSTLGIDTYNFKDFVKFRHHLRGVETEVSRNEMPRKNASFEQCEKVFNLVKERLLKD